MTYQNTRVSDTLSDWNYQDAKAKVIERLGFETKDDKYKSYRFFSSAINISREMNWKTPHPKAVWTAATMQYLNRHTYRFPLETLVLPDGRGENPSKHSLHAAYKWARTVQNAYDRFRSERPLTQLEEEEFSTYLDWGTRIVIAHDWGEVFGEASSVASRAHGGEQIEDPLAERKILEYILIRAAQTHNNFYAVEDLEKEILEIRDTINVQETGLQPILDLVQTKEMQDKIKNADKADILVKDFWIDHFDLIEFQNKLDEINPNNSITKDLNDKDDVDFLGRALKVTERSEGTSHLARLSVLKEYNKDGKIIRTVGHNERDGLSKFPRRVYMQRTSKLMLADNNYSEKNAHNILTTSPGMVESFIAQELVSEMYRLCVKKYSVLPPVINLYGGEECIHTTLAKYHMQLANGAQHQDNILLPIEKTSRVIDLYEAARKEILNYNPLETALDDADLEIYPLNVPLVSTDSSYVRDISEPDLNELEQYSDNCESAHIRAALKHHKISKELAPKPE